MKTIGKKKLNLSKVTLRTLADGKLDQVAGGAMNNSNLTHCWASGCGCIPPL